MNSGTTKPADLRSGERPTSGLPIMASIPPLNPPAAAPAGMSPIGTIKLPRCWCGNQALEPFSKDFLRCPSCHTLVAARMPGPEISTVRQDESGFYGKEYWFRHQEQELGLSNIVQRSRTDLPERCLHWLRTLLKYRLPPSTVLELGSSHGAFVGLMTCAGYDATGLELSPWVVEFAQNAFDVPMLLGPIEQQSIQPGTLDVIALMDVLEHLPDPAATMRHCVELLKPDGILLVQTPRLPEGNGDVYESLAAEKHPFLDLLREEGHLYLFSEQSLRQMFERLGCPHVELESPVFPHYDMFAVVSRQPLRTYAPDAIAASLMASPGGRIAQGMIDLDDQLKDALRQFAEADADRAARLGNVERLQKWYEEADRDRNQRLGVMEEQGREIARLHELVNRWGEENRVLDHEVGALREQLAAMHAQLEPLRRQAESLAELTEAFRRSASALGDENDALRRQLDAANGELEKRAAAEQHLTSELQTARTRLDAAQKACGAIRSSPVYRTLKTVRWWAWLEPVFERAFPATPPARLPAAPARVETPAPAAPQRKKTGTRVAIDLTPVLPGGDNGGAKWATLGLIQQLSKLAPDWEFILLTSGKSHEELAYLDAPNVRRTCVAFQAEQSEARPRLYDRVKMKVGGKLAAVLPAPMFDKLRRIDSQMSYRLKKTTLLQEIDADLLYCAFTAPFYYDPAIPTVSTVYDLQYLYYPQFFTSAERYYRDKHFREAVQSAAKIVCISDYVRGTILEKTGVPPDRVRTIHIRHYKRVERPAADRLAAVLAPLSLTSGRYLLYPANFWPHKNHAMLLTAYGMYRAAHPRSDLKLVLTGSPDARMHAVREAAEAMGLSSHVVFPGFLPDEDFASLLHACRAMVFPSLYEGFGMPVLEAMEFEKPVLCSNVTSLPEVAGDAALLFDPRKPQEIAAAIARIDSDDALAAELVEKGRQRIEQFGHPEVMAEQYMEVFRAAIVGGAVHADGVHGLYSDGWTKDRIVVTLAQSAQPRKLEVELSAPPWLPHDQVTVTTAREEGGRSQTHSLKRGQSLMLRCDPPVNGGFVEINLEPVFQPKVHGLNEDDRWLGCFCQGCWIVSGDGRQSLLKIES